MELEAEDGTTISITDESPTDIGRNLGFRPFSGDRTISRRHLSLRLTPESSAEPRVSFHVTGKNPIFVLSNSSSRIFKHSSAGELMAGDKLSLSLKNPRFLVLKKTDFDPVRDFGFLVKGHEFDQYSKLVDIMRWNWFLEESREKGGDDDEKKKRRRRKGKGRDGVEEEWSGESEEEEEMLVVRGGSGKRAKYSTRSKDAKKMLRKDVKARDDADEDEGEDEDEDEETLGGFIVDEEDMEENETDDDTVEEEELDDDDEDDE